jgi:hypothetical protein
MRGSDMLGPPGMDRQFHHRLGHPLRITVMKSARPLSGYTFLARCGTPDSAFLLRRHHPA